LAALRVRSVNMDVPISLGVILALGLSVVETINHAEHAYYDSAIMLLFFLLCGRYLDRAMRVRTRAAASNLAAYRAATAYKLDAKQQLIEVPAAALKTGDLIIVRPGDRIPADGTVVEGSSEIDDSLITGETAVRGIACGASVYAGSQNISGALTLRITAAGENTLLDEIERLLDKAVASKSRIVRLTDRAARYYAPIVHTAAALTLAGWLLSGASLHDALVVAISVLIITCPCALALAVPAVQVVAAGRLFRSGVLLNGGDTIERLAEVDTVVFDKTGTLTLPEPNIVNAPSVPRDLLEMAARLALSSRHPLAAALAREAGDRRPFPHVSEQPGGGVRAVIDGAVARLGSRVFCELEEAPTDVGSTASTIAFRLGDHCAVFEIRQSLRPGAEQTIRELTALGLELHIISGDRPEAVAPIAAALQISHWRGELTPADKVHMLGALRAEGRKVLMVGDGLNDAPSLAAAHVSISPITGADLSQAHADAVFLGARLAPVAEAIVTTRFAQRLMRQNLWLAAIYNAVAVPIAVFGFVTPLIAALAMSGSSLMVTANALRGRLRRTARIEQRPAAQSFVQARWSTP
jgi:Cu2+-exporting ATPase